jgi:hypothetical protein
MTTLLDTTDAHDRISKLEHDCRDMRRAMIMLSAGTVVAGLVAAFGGGLAAAVGLALAAGAVVVALERQRFVFVELLRVHKLEIVGDDGVTRIALGETELGTGALAIHDGAGALVECMPSGGGYSQSAR